MSLRSFLITVVAAFVGVVAGLIIGANIGGNWFTSSSLGGLHGYEATAMMGAVIGGVVLGMGALWVSLRRGSK